MRRPLKYRLSYLATIAIIYIAGFQLIPQLLVSAFDISIFAIFAVSYFVLIPSLYWFWVIKIGQQKRWRMIIPFSMAGLIARFSFPSDIAQYFEFIMWAKYPILAVVLVLELFIVYSVVQALWQARKLSGDPRVNMLSQYEQDEQSEKKEKKLTLSLMLAYEPSSWYYFVKHFSRKHTPAIGHLRLLSAKRWHIMLLLLGLLCATALIYYVVSGYSEIGAVLLSGFVIYGLVILCANHRVSRYYSLYLHQDQLVINNSMWGLMVIPLKQISLVESVILLKSDYPEALIFGRGKYANIKLSLARENFYYSNMGQTKDAVTEVYLCVDSPEQFQSLLQSI
ncbi:MAG: hypothetical protein ACJAVV_002268 [Alphaproteobacteria bacterium]|jgi:hypothetical protein